MAEVEGLREMILDVGVGLCEEVERRGDEEVRMIPDL